MMEIALIVFGVALCIALLGICVLSNAVLSLQESAHLHRDLIEDILQRELERQK